MDPFGGLPSPILLEIIKLIPDLPSLQNIDRASPVVASLFDECASEITDAVICTSLTPRLCSLFRTVVAVRCPALPSPSLKDFVESYVYGDASAKRLPRNIPAKILREMFSIHCNIQILSHLCLKTLIGRVNSISPSHAIRKKFISYISFHDQPGIQYQPQDGGPPSWIEEQRVIRGLWRLLVFFELRRVASSEDQISEEPRRFWRGLDEWHEEEVQCIYELLKELPASYFTTYCSDREQLHCLPTAKPIIIPSDWTHFEPPLVTPDLQYLRQTPEYLETSPRAFGFWRYLRRYPHLSGPAYQANFDIFGRIGFGIWDRRRMLILELDFGTPPENFKSSVDSDELIGTQRNQSTLTKVKGMQYTWISILVSELSKTKM